MKEGKEKGLKETRGFIRPQQENLKYITEENRNLSWSSNIEKIKEANSLDNIREPIINYQEGQNITKKDHKINNVTLQTDNTISI